MYEYRDNQLYLFGVPCAWLRDNQKAYSQWMFDSPFDCTKESIDGYNMRHIEECPGCFECEHYLMMFYSACRVCNQLGHKDVMDYDEELGEYICCACEETMKRKNIKITAVKPKNGHIEFVGDISAGLEPVYPTEPFERSITKEKNNERNE